LALFDPKNPDFDLKNASFSPVCSLEKLFRVHLPESCRRLLGHPVSSRLRLFGTSMLKFLKKYFEIRKFCAWISSNNKGNHGKVVGSSIKEAVCAFGALS